MRLQSLTLLRMIWALPCSLLGALLGLVVLILGGSLRRVDHTLEFGLRNDSTALPRWARRLGYEAITFGHVIIGQSHSGLQRLRVHERVHVRQYERWGALFLIAYPLSSLHAWWRGGCPYRDNHFEIEAFASESCVERSDS